MLRTGARVLKKWKENHNAKSATVSNGSAILASLLGKQHLEFLRMSRTGAQFCPNRGATRSIRDPSTKTTFKAKSPIFNIERRFFEDAPSESAILKRTRAPKCLRDGRPRRHGGRQHIKQLEPNRYVGKNVYQKTLENRPSIRNKNLPDKFGLAS